MKKSDVLRLRTRKLIAKNLIILVALAVVAFVGAFSWFSHTTTASAGSLTAKTKVSDALEYYIMPAKDDNGSQVDQYSDILTRLSQNETYNQGHPNEPQKNTKWHLGEKTLDTSDAEFKFLEDLFLSETTSDGITFKIPKLMQFGEIAYVDTTVNFEDAVPNENYMSFDLYFRCKTQNCTVQLTNESSITPVNGENLSRTTPEYYDVTDDANEESIKPAAIGAVRLSILNASNERQVLWIPAPNVWYSGSDERLYTGLSGNGYNGKGHATSDGNAITTTNEGTNNHAYYTAAKQSAVINSGDSNAEGEVVASDYNDYKFRDHNNIGDDGVSLVTLNQMVDVNNDEISDDGYYYGHVRVNLWMEGEDAEARLKMVGGKFVMNLSFDILNPD